MDEFRRRGFGQVVGIDLFSQRMDILTMDMHALLFPADSFDAVYSSHSLEHSYDPGKVVREMFRVARDGALIAVEVPVRGQASAADRIVFSGLDELRETIRPYVREELWAEEQPARTSTNGQGCEIARIVFSVRKGTTQPTP